MSPRPIYLALYKGRRDGSGWRVWSARFTDWLTRQLTRGRYSHCEVVIGLPETDASGAPLDVRVIQRSGSRELDRAAQEAVRNWRFQPAQSNGQPMQGSLEIPFDFKPAP